MSGEDGSYEIRALPRDARLRTRMPGYQPATVTAEATEIRLKPGALTVQVNQAAIREDMPDDRTMAC